jgi:hypothetical protein
MKKQACLQREQQGLRQCSSLTELTELFECCELNELIVCLSGLIELIGC